MAANPAIATPSNTGKIRAWLPRPGGAAHLHGMKREGWSPTWRPHVRYGDRRRTVDMPYNHEHRRVGEVPSVRIAVVHRLCCSGIVLGRVRLGRGIGHRSAYWRADLDGPQQPGIGRIDREALLHHLRFFR